MEHSIRCIKKIVHQSIKSNFCGFSDDDIVYVLTVPTTGGENAKLIMREAAVNVRKFEQFIFYLAGPFGLKIKINIHVIKLKVTAVGKTKSSGWDIVNQITVSFEHVKNLDIYIYETDCQLFSGN